jgi:hypothetical protein
MLADAVERILGNTVLPDELIIVDQSDRPHPQLAQLGHPDCAVRYVFPSTKGLSRANNEGVRQAAPELLLLTHDDVKVDSDWVRELVSAFAARSKAVVVTGRVAATEPEVEGGFAPSLKDNDRAESFEGRVGHDVLEPTNMAMTKSMLASVGRFSERLGPGTPFPGAEDADLGPRYSRPDIAWTMCLWQSCGTEGRERPTTTWRPDGVRKSSRRVLCEAFPVG